MKSKLTNTSFQNRKRLLMILMRAFFFLCCTTVFALSPNNVISQNSKIKIKEDRTLSVDQVFDLIMEQTDYNFFYEEGLFDDYPEVQLEKGIIRTKMLLNESLSQGNVTITVTDKKTILIQKDLPNNIMKWQEPEITGTVTDSNGTPLPGANIIEKGTSNGVTADFDGNFSIKIADNNAILIISYIGFTTKEVQVNNQTNISVSLKEKEASLDEVVVIGYGTVKKSDLTGSVVSLDADQLNQVNVVSADQMLQGRVAGVQITQTSHAPGGGVSVRIRGTGSITAGQEPLYVVDGFPINNVSTANGRLNSGFEGSLPVNNPLNSINPADIKSIEILKDASAAAIYGSRGSNGVVIITTKSGISGSAPQFNFNTSYSVSKIRNKIDVLSTSEYINIMNQLEIARGNAEPFNDEFINSVGAGIDWQDEILQTGSTQSHNLSLSGQSGGTTYYSSLSYYDQEGIVKNTGYDRFQARLNLDQKLGDKFTFGMKLNTSLERNKSVPVNGFGKNEEGDAVYTALNNAPVNPVFNDDGTIFRPTTDGMFVLTLGSPYGKVNGQMLKEEINRTLVNIFGEYSIVPELKAKITFGSDRSTKRNDIYSNRLSLRGEAAEGIATIVSGELSSTLLEGILTYSNTIGDKHSLTALVGSTYQSFVNRTFSAGTQGFASDIIETNGLGIGIQAQNQVASFASERRLLSYISRINYGFHNKYLLTASLRADGSSNFGDTNRYGYFPSFSGAWKINNESFLMDSSVLSELKLRAGWGQLGNDNIGIARALATYSGGAVAVIGGQQVSGVSPSRIPNPNLKWETSEQLNFGLDFGFFNSRIKGSIDYFRKSNKDLLLDLPIPSTSGFSILASNIGQVDNSGIEVMLNTVNLNGALQWSTDLNFSTLTNKVVSLGNIPEIIHSSAEITSLIRPGEPLYSYYGTKAIGIFQEGQDPIAAQPNIVPGNPIWLDANGDDVINDADRVVIGNPYPDFNFGINNSLSYKNFQFTAFVDGALGQQLMTYTLYDAIYPNDNLRNRLAEPWLNRWTPDNPTNKWPSGLNTSSYRGSQSNSFSVANASFVRLKNVQLTYAVPVDNISALKSLDIFIGGQNLLVITDYPGYDPDVNSLGQSGARIDRMAYPSSRVFQLGINVGF
ncbi:TonB-dependent receptor [Arenibacter sp. ARW7G5Y1]|uniref:SusC/RagA family TonB-linked outer membrane protein n=1 Tax=Arenibacter sp. ARW7G5Y1 TaxID=2135619 RepID=UPI000D77464A|nr:TonB-dependent receptor [Arenibacter sp. ARW7G5Y1]PXX21461.1 TonB-linked SusC/RagA family outer membrane protein [Arenibacter sp. ARW7G5Y1]